VKKSGEGKKIKVESSARYLPVDENYECYNPLEGLTDSTYRRRLIRWLWRYLIYNTKDFREFDSEWYADALSLSQKLNGPVSDKKFDVDCDLPNYFDEVENVVKFADTNFVMDEKFIETCLCALPDKFLVGYKWWWAMCCTKMAMSIFEGGLPKCKEYFLHKFSKKVPARMKAVNYSHEGNEIQWDEVKPCSVGVSITWLSKFHPDVVKTRESEIKYCWADLFSFSCKDSKGHSRKEIKHFLLDTVVIDRRSELFYLITCKDDPHIKMWTSSKFKNECDMIYALKKLPQHKSKDGDEEAPPKYVKKLVSLWDYVRPLRSKLAVVCTYFKPALIPEPLHVQRAKKYFNTFAGFNNKYDPNFKVDESQFDLILQHICKVWCNDQQSLFDYVTKWMAYIIQRPYKTGVALLVYLCKNGVRKSMLANWFAKYVIGLANYTTVQDMNDLLSRFNGRK